MTKVDTSVRYFPAGSVSPVPAILAGDFTDEDREALLVFDDDGPITVAAIGEEEWIAMGRDPTIAHWEVAA